MNFIELILGVQGYPILKAKKELAKLTQLDFYSFSSWQLLQRDAIFKYHLINNQWYGKFVGDLRNSWEDIPIIQKKHLQQPLLKLLSKPYRISDVYVGSTSGSSGQPFFLQKTRNAIL